MREPIAVPRVEGISGDDFKRRHLRASRPVVVAGGAAGWAAARWTPEVLRDKAGPCMVLAHRSDSAYFGLDEASGGPKYQEQEMTLAEYVALACDPPQQGLRYYLQRANIPERLPCLMADLKMPPGVDPAKIYLMNLWFGPAENVTRLHYDVPNNFLVHLHGRKRVVLFAPGDTRRLYPFRTKAYNMSQVNIDQPDIAAFPGFAQAQPYETEIGPGDMLYIPPFWWHQVYSLEIGISANYWWLPRLSQLLAPQITDTFGDIVQALAQRLRHPPAAPAVPVCDSFRSFIIKRRPSGAKKSYKEVRMADEDDDQTIYSVVVNDEAQYSIWPAWRDLPKGWQAVGKQGLKDECLAYIKEVWTDMRPLSLRRHMESQG